MMTEQIDGHGDRVREHSPRMVNRRIDALARSTVDECIQQGHDAIVQRLDELDREWDIDRVMMVHFAVLGGAPLAAYLGRYARRPLLARRRRGLLYVSGVQLGFLLMHATIGWSPPALLYRGLGFRTAREIAAERNALRSALESSDLAPRLEQA